MTILQEVHRSPMAFSPLLLHEYVFSLLLLFPYFTQITWRFLAPILVFTIMVSSIVSESITTPVYSAWNKDKAESEKLPFPPWCLGIAIALALGSLMPLVVVGILRALGVKKNSSGNILRFLLYSHIFFLNSSMFFHWT